MTHSVILGEVMPTDTFTWRTQKSAQGTDTVRTLQAQFGDGYKQVAASGITAKAETWNLSWTGKKSEASAIPSISSEPRDFILLVDDSVGRAPPLAGKV